MAKEEKPSDLMLSVRDGLIIIDSVLLEYFEIEDGYKRAMLSIRCMESFGNLNDISKEKIITLITKTVTK